MQMKLYHGSDKKIICPKLEYARDNLDFGKGIYFTTYKEQAEKWAMRKKLRYGKSAIVNVYHFEIDSSIIRVMDFKEETEQWLDYVLACRKGSNIYKQYDIVIGPVADDDVFKVIDFYSKGIWTKERVIKEIRYFKKNNQVCILNQTIIDTNLKFINAEEF